MTFFSILRQKIFNHLSTLSLIILFATPLTSKANEQPVFKITSPEDVSETAIAAHEWFKSIYAEMGYKTELVLLPTARGIKLTNDGKYDAELGRIANITIHYPNLIQLPDPYLKYAVNVAYLNSETSRPSSLDEVLSSPTGYILGAKFMEKTLIEANATAVRSTDNLISMLKHKRIRYALAGGAQLNQHIRETSGIVIQDKPIMIINIYHYVHKKHKKLTPQLQLLMQEKIARQGLFKVQ